MCVRCIVPRVAWRRFRGDVGPAALCILVVLVLGVGCAAPDRAPVEIDPEAAALLEQMQVAFRMGDYHGALVLADSAARYDAAGPGVDFTRGIIYSKLKRHAEARQALERVLAHDPGYRGAWFNLGHDAFLQEHYREALACYRKELELLRASEQHDEDHRAADRAAIPTIMVQIGRTYERLGVPDSARMTYEQALAVDSTRVDAHAWLSDLLENEGHHARALSHAERAFALDPADLDHAYRLGALLFQAGKAEEALPYLATVVRQRPGHEGATYNLGRALVALGRPDEGQHYLDRIAEVQRLQEGIYRAERGIYTYPGDPQRWTALAALMVRGGYLDKAYESYSIALSLRPGDLALQNDLANVALAMGDTTQAIARYEVLLRQDSTFADGWLNLGVVHAMAGDREAARAAWQQALRYDPDHAEAQAYLTRLD